MFVLPHDIPLSLNFAGGVGSKQNSTSSGATKCSYNATLQIQQDGTCRFSGFYSNRGDVPVITAPDQAFGVSIVVLDINNTGYSFSVGGKVHSAPQSGSEFNWDQTSFSEPIAQNWPAIAARGEGQVSYSNNVDVLDVLSEVSSAVQNAIKDVQPIISAVQAAVPVIEAVLAA